MRHDSLAAGPIVMPVTETGGVASPAGRVSLSYGKGLVVVYRLDIGAQEGVIPIPESDFIGSRGGLLAVRATVEVDGTELLPAWTDGDNGRCVATDTMKNALLYDPATFDGTDYRGIGGVLGSESGRSLRGLRRGSHIGGTDQLPPGQDSDWIERRRMDP